MSYFRYVVGDRLDEPAWLTGVITTAGVMIRNSEFSRSEARIVRQCLAWFNRRVPCPPFKKQLESGEWSKDAVSWFRQVPEEPRQVLKPLIKVLRSRGLTVREMVTEHPGRIVYEDYYQVVADVYPEGSYEALGDEPPIEEW